MFRQTAGLHRLDGPIRQSEPYPQPLPTIERNTDISVKQPQRTVITRNHYRSPLVPAGMRGTLDFTFLYHHLFKAFIQSAYAEWPFSQGAQQLIFIKCLNDSPGSAPSRNNVR